MTVFKIPSGRADAGKDNDNTGKLEWSPNSMTVLRYIVRQFLQRHKRLQSYPPWVPAETVREMLFELLDLRDPELFLVLEANNTCVEWKCFRTNTVFKGTKEDAIASLYLAHLVQWCQEKVHTSDGKSVPWTDRLVLDPQPFVEFLETRREKRLPLEKVIYGSEAKCLDDIIPTAGWKEDWRNRREVLKWQTNLALWWKRTRY